MANLKDLRIRAKLVRCQPIFAVASPIIAGALAYAGGKGVISGFWLALAAALLLAATTALTVAYTRSLTAPLDAIVRESRRRKQTSRENERLLLSLLPASVAERLRSGELGERFEGLHKTLEAERRGTLEALAAYLPMDRRQAIARGCELPEVSVGTVLFADISGFTPLTEALAEELGPRQGAEELTRQLNRVYGALIGEVHRVRGSVVGFSGDAITCWFDGDDGRRAVACGLNMQRVMTWFHALRTPSGQSIPLAIKAAASRGTVRRILAGDPDIQVLDVLAGSTLDRMAVAEGMAKLGEVVVGPELLASFGAALRLEAERRDGEGRRFGVVGGLRTELEEDPWETIADDALTAEQVRPWLLPATYERLRDGQGAFLADLRPVVALFLKFEGLDFELDEAAPRHLDAYVRWVQGILTNLEGSLIQLTTGDKGSYLYAVFGAPVALEDAAERAVAAALDLRETPPEISSFITATRIGLSQGRMRTGAYGSDTRHTYGVLGDETNLAARLMGRAEPGQILVSQRIAKRADGSCRFRDLGHIEVKGKRQPIAVFEALERLGAGTQLHDRVDVRRTTMIGRRQERLMLSFAVLGLKSEDLSANVVVEGAAGIGKSRLVADLIEQLRRPDPEARNDRETALWFAAADPIRSSTAYYAWRAVLRQVLALHPSLDAEAQRRRTLECLEAASGSGGERDLAELAPLLNAVLPLDLPETASTASLLGEGRATATRRLVVQLLRHAADGCPVVLVVEDAHWLDSASWRLIRRVSQEIRPLLLVIVSRTLSEAAPRELQQLLDDPDTFTLALEALSPEETETLVGRRLGTGEVPAELSRLILEKAGGNPFFSEELADALRDAGLIRVEDGVCTVEHDLGGLEFPETVEGVVSRRIDRLTPQQQMVLKVASVIGRTFTFDLLHDVLPMADAKEQLPELLDGLVALEVLSLESSAPELAYAFKDNVTREVAYGLMLFEQRRQLHRAIAEWTEHAHADDPAVAAALLAHHWSKAIERHEQAESPQVARTVDYFLQAGRQAQANAASVEAIRYLTRGLKLLGHLAPSRERQGREMALRSVQGVALIATRGPADDDVRRNFARARELSDQLGDTSQRFAVTTGLWYHHLFHADRAEATALSAELLETARKSGRPQLLINAHQAVGATALYAGELERARRHLDEVINLDERVSGEAAHGQQSALLAQTRNPVMVAHGYAAMAKWFLGHPDQARSGLARGMAMAEASGHPLALTSMLFAGAAIERRRRDLAAAERLARRAVAMAEEQGFPFWGAMGTSILGGVALARGAPDQAVQLLERSLEGTGSARIYATPIYADLIKAHLELGNFDAAEAAAKAADEMVATRLARFFEAELQRLRGELRQLQGDATGAEGLYHRALEVARAQGARSLELRAAIHLGRLWQRQGKTAAAQELVRGVYDGFTEGFDTGDLREARALIEELAPPGTSTDRSRAAPGAVLVGLGAPDDEPQN